MSDLEKMSKQINMNNSKGAKPKPQKREGMNRNIMTVIPKEIRDNPDFRFGKPAYLPGNQRVTEVINYEYLREFLEKNVTDKAQYALIK